MEPLSSYSDSESAEFHLIMNVCGENPIMALLHQAYRKHRSVEAKAFKGHISQLDGVTMQIRTSILCEPASGHIRLCVDREKNAFMH